MSLTSKLVRLSAAGTGLSLLCAIHCFLTAVLLALAPVLGTLALFDESVEEVLIVVAVIVAAVVLAAGFRKHRRRKVLGLFVLAVVLIAIGRSGAEGAFEVVFVGTGATALAVSQFWNLHLSRACCPTAETPLSDS